VVCARRLSFCVMAASSQLLLPACPGTSPAWRPTKRESLFRSTATKLFQPTTCSNQGFGTQCRAGEELLHARTPPELDELLDPRGRTVAEEHVNGSREPETCFDDISEIGTESTIEPFDSDLEWSVVSSTPGGTPTADCCSDSLASTHAADHSNTSSHPYLSGNASSSDFKVPSAQRQSAKYLSGKLSGWFTDVLASNGASQVDFRQFLAALRRHPALQSVLAEAANVNFSHDEQRAHKQLHRRGPLGASVQERAELLLKERARIKQIFQQMCDDGNGTLGLPGFLEFFAKRRLMLDSM